MSLSKRRKSKCEPSRNPQLLHSEISHNYLLDTLPPEVLEMILRFLPFQDVSSSVRLVSKRCHVVATTVLNSAFFALGKKFQKLIQNINVKLKNSMSRIDHCLYRSALSTLELLHVQYKLLRAVTWRYTHPPKPQRSGRLCFYAGSLLDDLHYLLQQAATVPSSFVAYDCQYFIIDCKRFMNFFEKVSERRINRSALVSGCKIVDLLDCLIEGRELLFFKVLCNGDPNQNLVHMGLRYVMTRAWFTCFEVPSTDGEDCWRDEQRFMYLRLRRLVASVNEHLLGDLFYDQESVVQESIPFTLRPPTASTYSGYGEYGGKFFYYGNMNKYAYETKFKFTDALRSGNGDVGSHETQNSTYFDLVVTVELKCSLDLVPLAVRPNLELDDLDCSTEIKKVNRELFLKMDVNCAASETNRLPKSFTWELRSPQQIKRMCTCPNRC